MKKTFSVVLALLMVLSVCTFASAEGKDYSGYTIRIYSNSNSTERATWLENAAKAAGFTISLDDNSVISGDTAAIQAAILACPPQSRVLLPAGVWRVTHLFLRDHLRLELAQGATLLGSYDKAHLPVFPGMLQSWDEETEYNLGTWEGNPLPCYAALLTGLHARDVEIYGPGKVEGSGAPPLICWMATATGDSPS